MERLVAIVNELRVHPRGYLLSDSYDVCSSFILGLLFASASDGGLARGFQDFVCLRLHGSPTPLFWGDQIQLEVGTTADANILSREMTVNLLLDYLHAVQEP